MKKITKTILIFSIAIFSGSLLLINPVQANGDISVEIQDETGFKDLTGSIFNVSNFLPGDTKTERIKVINSSSTSQTVGLKVIDFDRGCVDIDNYCLADKLILTITEVSNSSSTYSGSLTDFYKAGEIPLSGVSTKGEVQYDLSVYFDKDVEEEKYQNSTTDFDLEIGFFTKETISEESYSGGGGYVPPIPGVVTSITISGFSAVTSDSATIKGATDISSFCRVIYDNTSHPSLGEPPNYGYEWSTEPTDTKTTSHDMTLTDLKSKITYFYRVVCWASPEKISGEHSFITLAAAEGEKEGEMSPEQETEENISGEEEEKEEEGIISSEETGKSKKENGEEKEETKEKPKNEEPSPKAQPEVKGVAKPDIPPKEPPPRKLSNETPENKTGLIANLAMASGKITQSPFLTFVVILCLVSLVAVGVRKWWLFQKKRKK